MATLISIRRYTEWESVIVAQSDHSTESMGKEDHEMEMSQEECQRARIARDARFDGKFYVAVKTTKIFCRPICPANLPLEKNVEYFHDKAQALQSGYRPCLRCRPDSAPSSWAWKGTEVSFQRAVKMIEQGDLQNTTLALLAERLGITDRYLRQLFDKYMGMSPKQYAQYHQLMFAKQLLHNSSMTITDIAFASGFNSVRRFNDAFKTILRLSPSQIRKTHTSEHKTNQIQLAFQTPLNWQHMLGFYRLRAIHTVELVEENSYQRSFTLNGTSGWFKASLATENALTVEFDIADPSQLKALVVRLRRMFDLDANVLDIEAQLSKLAPDMIVESGIRIPGLWNEWEAGVRAILGQQVSVKAAINQLNVLVDQCGEQVGGKTVFPSPATVSEMDLSFLRMPQSRKDTLARFARFMLENPQAPASDWIALKGIGPWTINYAQMRGSSQPDLFLDNDLVVKKAITKWPELNKADVAPWGSYATLHCWNNS